MNRYDVPPLILLVNPKNLDMNWRKLIAREQTIGGYVEAHWGEDLDRISCSGVSKPFKSTDQSIIIGATGEYKERDGGGAVVEGALRRDTEGWKKHKELLEFYKINGTRQDETSGKVLTEEVIELRFSDWIFYGVFTDFRYSESALKPFLFDYSFSMEVYNTVTIQKRIKGAE